jgi:hypothetical protein
MVKSWLAARSFDEVSAVKCPDGVDFGVSYLRLAEKSVAQCWSTAFNSKPRF